MKIAHLIDNLHVGGAQNLILTFAQHCSQVSQNDDDGHHLDVISLEADHSSPLYAQLAAVGVTAHCLPSRKLFRPRRDLQLVRFLQTQRYDVIQTHLTRANILGNLAGFLTRTPVVSTLHSIGENVQFYNPYRRLAETLVLRTFPKRIIAVGAAVAQAHRQRLGGDRISVLLNPTEMVPPISPPQRAAIRQGLMQTADRPFLISVGRLIPAKGYPDLIRALARIKLAHPQVFLAIVGGGTLQPDLEREVNQLGLGANIELLGFRTDVHQLLAAADIFVNASVREGLPLAVLEAMSARLPVVATRVGDVPNVVTDQTGLLVDPENPDQLAMAIQHLLENPDKLNRMGLAAKDHVDQYHNPKTWTQDLLDFYTAVIDGGALQ